MKISKNAKGSGNVEDRRSRPHPKHLRSYENKIYARKDVDKEGNPRPHNERAYDIMLKGRTKQSGISPEVRYRHNRNSPWKPR